MKGNFKNWLIKSLLILAVTFGFISFSHVTTYAATAEVDTTATVGGYNIKVPAGAEIPTDGGSTIVTEITSSTASLDEGWYVVNQDVTLTSQLVLNGNVNIILCDGKKLEVNGTSKIAIDGSDKDVTIWGEAAGTGEMIAQSESRTAINVNAITINGGKLKASGNGGICAYGTITINAGTVEAVGSGNNGIDASGSITMNNGTLKASGNNGIKATGTFTINAGTVEATGSGNNGINASGSFTMNNGTIKASGYIGINAYGTFTINAGTVEATGNNKFGIWISSSFIMNNGAITAKGSDSGIKACNSVTINGGKIEATGNTDSGFWTQDLFTINNGTIKANGKYYGIFCCDDFTINGGTVEATATGTDTDVNYFTCIYMTTEGKTVTIVDSAKVYLGNAAPETLYDGDDLTAELKKYKYAKIQCKEETPKQDNTATVEAPSTPAMQSTSINGTKLDSWDAVSNAIKSVKAAELNKVADASDSMLQLNIVGTTDKIVPVAVVKALNQANFKFFHIFVGEGDAVTFDTAADNSNYTGISFAHTDTVTETSRTIDFTSKGAIGLNVLFHTTVPKTNATVTIYRMDNGSKVLVATTVSNANGQLCFAIDKTAEYILEY